MQEKYIHFIGKIFEILARGFTFEFNIQASIIKKILIDASNKYFRGDALIDLAKKAETPTNSFQSHEWRRGHKSFEDNEINSGMATMIIQVSSSKTVPTTLLLASGIFSRLPRNALFSANLVTE